MNDRTLLELAAKACGLSPDFEYVESMGMAYLKADRKHLGQTIWNPLTDDGDALRLACALEIDVEWWRDAMHACARKVGGTSNLAIFSDHGNDKTAATRRAIVRAAAELGKSI